MELTLKQISEHIDKFTSIYENGNEVNPLPDNVKLTVWCEGRDEEGFLTNVTKGEMGIEVFIVKSWIREDELRTLCGVEI